MYDVDNKDEYVSDATHSGSETNATSSKLVSRIRTAKAKASAKTKDAMARIASRALDKDRVEDETVSGTLDNPAFYSNISEESLEIEHSPMDKVKSAANSAANALLHPKRTAQAKAKQATAGKLSGIRKPHSSPSHAADLVQAHDDLHSSFAEISEFTQEGTVGLTPKQKRRTAHLARLEADTESRQAAWIIERVDRVKVVSTQKRPYPDQSNYYIKHKDGRVSLDFACWVGHLALWYTQGFTAPYIDDFDSIPFDLRTFRSHAERLAVATIPWQVWAMDVRAVYQWQDPWRTARWLTLWTIFWYFEYVASFLFGSIIYYTIQSKINPQFVQSLRTSLQRAENRETAAFGVGEFIDRHGDHDWVDPLIDQLGPYVQLQMYDLLNLLEVLANFYSWSSPKYTIRSLFFIGSCFMIAAFTELRYALKIFWFIVGNGFFFCWPIASLYPRYRILVSPFRWVFWDIPTDAERSFAYLSQQCQQSRNAMIEKELDHDHENSLESTCSSDSSDHEHDHNITSSSDESFHSVITPTDPTPPAKPSTKALLSYRCLYDSKPGRLHITTSQLIFTSSFKRQNEPLWQIAYLNLSEMRKYKRADGPSVEKHSRSKHEGIDRMLELEDKDGNVYTLDLRDHRDQAFNYILGYSGAVVRWRNLQC